MGGTTVYTGPAAPDGDNQCDTVQVPIVFVPGMMATILLFKKKKLKTLWDPDQEYMMLKNWIERSAAQKKKILMRNASIVAAQQERGRYSVPGRYYRKLFELIDSENLGPLHVFGYDWRKSNWDHADRFAALVEKIVKDKHIDDVIVVTHSMGGLVVRCALKRKPELNDKIRGVIHVCQPAAGAPVVYRRFLAGADPAWGDGDEYVSQLYGKTAQEFALMASVIPSTMELFPTKHYSDNNKPWVFIRYVGQDYDPPYQKGMHEGFQQNRVTKAEEKDLAIADIHTKYATEDDGGLFFEPLHRATLKKPLLAMAKKAMESHEELDLHKHPNTWVIYSTGMPTDVATRWDVSNVGGKVSFRGISPVRRSEGDETVPALSGAALFPDQKDRDDVFTYGFHISKTNIRQFMVYKAKHAECFNNDKLLVAMKTLLTQMSKRCD